MRVSNSKLKTFRRCAKQYEYKYVQNLRSKRRGLALERGSWIHELLMVHMDGEDWRERQAVLTKQFNNLFEEEREELGDLPTECSRIMRSYLRTYKSDEQRYHVIDTEMDEIVTLPNGLRLQIIIDVIVEDLIDGGLWIRDYKTRKSFHDPATLMRDPQLTLYYWGVEHMGYKPLRGAIVDEIRTKAPAIPERLQTGGLSKRKNIDTDVHTYAAEIRRFGLDIEDYRDHLLHIAKNQRDRFFRRTAMPKDPPVIRTTMREAVETAQAIQQAERTMRFPRSPDYSCEYGCEFKDICLVELYGGDASSLIKMNFEVNRRGND